MLKGTRLLGSSVASPLGRLRLICYASGAQHLTQCFHFGGRCLTNELFSQALEPTAHLDGQAPAGRHPGGLAQNKRPLPAELQLPPQSPSRSRRPPMQPRPPPPASHQPQRPAPLRPRLTPLLWTRRTLPGCRATPVSAMAPGAASTPRWWSPRCCRRKLPSRSRAWRMSVSAGLPACPLSLMPLH